MHPKLISERAILNLLSIQGEYACVASIYIPVHKVTDGASVKADRTLLKNALKDISKQIKDCGYDKGEIDSFFEGGQDILDDNEFWQNLNHGLAIFLTPTHSIVFNLPVEVDPISFFGDRFLLTPLMLLIDVGEPHYLLSLNLNCPKLYRASYIKVEEITPQNMPKKMKSALNIDEYEQEQQFHSVRSAGGGRTEAMYHGHGAAKDNKDSEINNYLRLVDKALEDYRDEIDQSGLVIAGTPDHVASFKSVSRVVGEPTDIISGNFENREPALKDMMRERIYGQIEGRKTEFTKDYNKTPPTKKLMSKNPSDLQAAARSGKISSVAVAAFYRTRDTVSNLNKEIFKLELSYDERVLREVEELAQYVFSRGGQIIGLLSAARSKTMYALMRY